MARSLPSLVGEKRHRSLSIFLIHVKKDKRVLILSCFYQYFNETAFVPTRNSLFLIWTVYSGELCHACKLTGMLNTRLTLDFRVFFSLQLHVL